MPTLTRWKIVRPALAGALALALGAGFALPGHAAGNARPEQPRYLSGNNGDPNSSGSAQTVTGPNGSQAAQLTSVNYGYGVVSVGYPAGTTFSQLSRLSSQYTMTEGSCAGGAPRYQIDLLPQGDTNISDAFSLYVYFGTPPYGGCSTGGPQNEANIIGGTTPQWFVFGGGYNSNVPYTYSQIETMFGDFQMLDTQIALDAGWAQSPSGGTQQVLIQNWDVSGTVFFASPGGNATCTGPLPGGTYRNVTARAGCSIDDTVLIEGNLTVVPGGTLTDTGATIEGNLTALRASWLQIEGGSIGGNVQAQSTSFSPDSSNANDLCNTSVGGSVLVQNSFAAASFEIGAAPDCTYANSIGGNLQVQSNAGTVDIGGDANDGSGNVVNGTIIVSSNRGGGTLTNNSAGNNCMLQGNHPPIFGSGNSAGHNNSCNQAA